MKKYILILMTGASLAFASCGGEEKPVEVAPPSVSGTNDMMNNLLKQGIQEATQQLGDSTSMLSTALDTLKDVIKDNKDVIGDKVEEGINALNKAM